MRASSFRNGLMVALVAAFLVLGTSVMAAPSGSLKAGTYSAIAAGKNGDVKIEVVLDDHSIVAVRVVQSQETAGISDPALQRIPAAIVKGQTLAIDAVAGATYTSNAIVDAVRSCIVQAGGNPGLFEGEVAAATAEAESVTTDVAVVGGGAAGTSAGLAIAQSGVKVIVLEMTASPAGQGTQAGGLFATDSSLQKAAKQTVSAQWIYDQYVTTGNYQVNGELLTKIIQRSGTTVDWLMAAGAKFTLVWPGTGGYYEHRLTQPASTLHGYTEGGTKTITALQASIRKAGGEVRFDTKVTDLLLEDGKVAGVVAQKADGSVLKVHAKAVVLATGGFGGNAALVKEVFGDGFGTSRIGTNIGTGIALAQKAGADADYHKAIMMHYGVSRGGTNWGTPLNAALLNPYLEVNNQGRRFLNEEAFVFEPLKTSNAIKSLPGHVAWEIFDDSLIQTVKTQGYGAITDLFGGKLATDPTRYIEVGHPVDTAVWYKNSHTPADVVPDIEKFVALGTIVKADSVEALADKLKMPQLVNTVRRYNELAAKGDDVDHHKSARYLKPLKGTLYAVKITASTFLGTLGGVRIDADAQVLDTAGVPIPGLYTAGADATGVYGNSYVYFEGGTLGFAYGSGRIAGESAVQFVKAK